MAIEVRGKEVRRLSSLRAIVTGAGSGIGRAIALRFSEEGASVPLADLDEQAAEAVACKIEGETLVHQTNVHHRERNPAARPLRDRSPPS